MPANVVLSAAMPWRSLRLGPLRFTPYGLCAAAGLMSSMGLVRRGARLSGVDPEAAWDAGLFALLSCFVASRLLLALQSPSAFLHFPMLLLGLPSLTFGGMGLAALATVVYLRRKRLALLPLLDPFAAPAALLAAFLELGHWLDGSEAGMPTSLPWGVAAVGAPAALRVHPVSLYGVALALGLCVMLWRGSLAGARFAGSDRAWRPGSIAAMGLLGGGLAAFALDMLSVPPALSTNLWLEPGQWIALICILGGGLGMFLSLPRRSRLTTFQSPKPGQTTKPLHMEVH